MKFKAAGLDTPAYVVTALVCSFIILLDIFFIFMVPCGWAFALGILLIPIITFLYRPRCYSMREGNIVITKMIGTTITIPFSTVIGYTIIPDCTKLRVARLLGNGGLFGYYGIFATAEYGMVNCQLTRTRDIVLIKTKVKCYAISPQDIQQFISYLEQMVSPIQGKIERFEPSRRIEEQPASTRILILPIFLFLITIGILVLTYSTLPDTIPVHFDLHGTPDRYGSRISYLITTGIPSVILLIVSFIVFFTVRMTTQKKSITNLMVTTIAFLQIFIGYISLDTFWMAQYGYHILPIIYIIAIFVIVMTGLMYYYYRVVTQHS